MLDLFNIPTPQQSNYQEFYGGDQSNTLQTRTWVKPRGCSMVRFMLIGAGANGGNGNSTTGGGGGSSGAVTSWIGPAMFVPDNLIVTVGRVLGANTLIKYLSSNGENILLTAGTGNGGLPPTGGPAPSAMAANQFTASGIFTSIAGQAGATGSSTGAGGNISASATTFLSGGAGGAGGAGNTGGSVTPNYGYTTLPATTAGGTVKGADGYFITQPILVGTGGAGGSTSTTVGTAGGRGGIGCGGGGGGEDSLTGGGQGGNGAVYIWAW